MIGVPDKPEVAKRLGATQLDRTLARRRNRHRDLSELGIGDATPRPVVDVWLGGLDRTPLASLVDTGALGTRMAFELAEVAGVDLRSGTQRRFWLAGHNVTGTNARVSLGIGTANERHEWDASVWFCEPWPFSLALRSRWLLASLPDHYVGVSRVARLRP